MNKNGNRKHEAALKATGRFPGQLDMYHIFPILKDNEDYEIIYNHCRNNFELSEFTHDWKDYFLDLQSKVYLNPKVNPRDLFFTFDEWYQQNQRWKCTSYHHLYYQQQEKNYNFKNDKSREASEETESDDIEILYFTGVDDIDSLKKRYRDLLKIYHPDNRNGDTTVVQKIQTEYQYLFNKLI